MRKLVPSIAAGALLGLGIGGAILALEPASAAAERPPECVNITVQSAQSGGGNRNLHLDFCGKYAGGDSPLHDYVNGGVFTLDGGGMPGTACGGRADPCVIFPR